MTSSDDQQAADIAEYRVRRAAAHVERRRKKARAHFTVTWPDYGREIPPRLNPDVPDMIDQVKTCYVDLTQWISDFREKIVALVEAGKLHPPEGTGLFEHYSNTQAAVDAAIAHTLAVKPVAGVNAYIGGQGRLPDSVHRIADHAKYVYAVGSRDIAALQYRLSELAGTGRLDHDEHAHLQWRHCLPVWEILYRGTTSAVRDERSWDGGWQWSDNTYSDGRQVMVQVRLKNWLELERSWPYKQGMCGDGPLQEFPRGSTCQIAPVHDPAKDQGTFHPVIEIDLQALIDITNNS